MNSSKNYKFYFKDKEKNSDIQKSDNQASQQGRVSASN